MLNNNNHRPGVMIKQLRSNIDEDKSVIYEMFRRFIHKAEYFSGKFIVSLQFIIKYLRI
jgi:hypothetical protein